MKVIFKGKNFIVIYLRSYGEYCAQSAFSGLYRWDFLDKIKDDIPKLLIKEASLVTYKYGVLEYGNNNKVRFTEDFEDSLLSEETAISITLKQFFINIDNLFTLMPRVEMGEYAYETNSFYSVLRVLCAPMAVSYLCSSKFHNNFIGHLIKIYNKGHVDSLESRCVRTKIFLSYFYDLILDTIRNKYKMTIPYKSALFLNYVYHYSEIKVDESRDVYILDSAVEMLKRDLKNGKLSDEFLDKLTIFLLDNDFIYDDMIDEIDRREIIPKLPQMFSNYDSRQLIFGSGMDKLHGCFKPSYSGTALAYNQNNVDTLLLSCLMSFIYLEVDIVREKKYEVEIELKRIILSDDGRLCFRPEIFEYVKPYIKYAYAQNLFIELNHKYFIDINKVDAELSSDNSSIIFRYEGVTGIDAW